MRLLDLFCGAGGAAVGYYHAGYTEIIGVDLSPQPNFPFTFIQSNALNLPFDLSTFDLIHASPPCQAYIQRNKNLTTKWPKLIEPLRVLLQNSGVPFVIENVEGSPLINPVMLCGTMFNLPLRRHRLFEISIPFNILRPPCNHWGTVSRGEFAAVYGRGGKGPRRGAGIRDAAPIINGPNWNDAMGIDWMTEKEITQAIPPAYTKFIGKGILNG